MTSLPFIMMAVGASGALFGFVWRERLSISSLFQRLCRTLPGVFNSCLGQGVVEFTLVFLLFLVLAWIPADFGLAFYTGQLALNASREGARIAAADPTLTNGTTTCSLPACYSLTDGTVLKETAKRISSALMPGAQISVTYPVPGGVACNQQLQVNVSGNYNYFFYHLLRFFGADVPVNVPIIRSTQMRWEHQNTCI